MVAQWTKIEPLRSHTFAVCLGASLLIRTIQFNTLSCHDSTFWKRCGEDKCQSPAETLYDLNVVHPKLQLSFRSEANMEDMVPVLGTIVITRGQIVNTVNLSSSQQRSILIMSDRKSGMAMQQQLHSAARSREHTIARGRSNFVHHEGDDIPNIIGSFRWSS